MIKKSIIIILSLEILMNSMGCYSYTTLKTDDAKVSDKLNTVRITTIDDNRYILTSVTIDSTNVRGIVSPSQSEIPAGKQKKEIVIPLQKIKELEVKTYDSELTRYFVLGVIGLSLSIIIIVMIGHGSLSFGSGAY